MNEKLNPCPFCGGKATLLHPDEEGDDYVIGCYNECCGFSYERARSQDKQKVIDAWNKRANIPNTRSCIFTYDEDLHYWECSECEGAITFSPDSPNSPKDNDYRYCPFCGKKIIKEVRIYA